AEQGASAAARRLEPADQRREPPLVRERGDRVEIALQRSEPGPLDGVEVHAGLEVVADLALDRGALAIGPRRLLEQAPEEALIVLVELAVDAPARLVGGDRVALLPAVARVGVEVGAGVERAVHRRQVEARRV